MSDQLPAPSSSSAGGKAAIQRVAVDLEFEDGTFDTVILRPATLVATERHFKGAVPPIEGTLFGCYHQLHRGRPGAPTFADWLDTVAGIEERLAFPTSAAPAEQSPTSQ